MEKKVSVEISARHVHLPEDVYKKLFGEEKSREIFEGIVFSCK